MVLNVCCRPVLADYSANNYLIHGLVTSRHKVLSIHQVILFEIQTSHRCSHSTGHYSAQVD